MLKTLGWNHPFCLVEVEGHLLSNNWAGGLMRLWAVHLFGSASSSRIRLRKPQTRWVWPSMQAFLRRVTGITCHEPTKKHPGGWRLGKLQPENPCNKKNLDGSRGVGFFTVVFYLMKSFRGGWDGLKVAVCPEI